MTILHNSYANLLGDIPSPSDGDQVIIIVWFHWLIDSPQIMVEGVSKDSPAFNSGIQFGDRISVYTFASPDRVEDNNLVQFKVIAAILSDIKKAHTVKKSVIFVIQRSACGPVTYF